MGYSIDQLEQLWINAGGNTEAAPTAAAIAMAESSGNPSATNSNTNGTTDYGLWQINSVHFGETGMPDPSLIVNNPSYNAQAAVALFNRRGQTFGDWVQYNNGNYEQFLPQGALDWKTQTMNQNPTQMGPSVATNPQTGTVLQSATQSTTNTLGLFQNWLTKSGTNPLYIAIVAVFILVILASIKQTEKFAPWVAASILLILMFQQPATATPLPTVNSNPLNNGQYVNVATATYN